MNASLQGRACSAANQRDRAHVALTLQGEGDLAAGQLVPQEVMEGVFTLDRIKTDVAERNKSIVLRRVTATLKDALLMSVHVGTLLPLRPQPFLRLSLYRRRRRRRGRCTDWPGSKMVIAAERDEWFQLHLVIATSRSDCEVAIQHPGEKRRIRQHFAGFERSFFFSYPTQ